MGLEVLVDIIYNDDIGMGMEDVDTPTVECHAYRDNFFGNRRYVHDGIKAERHCGTGKGSRR